MKRSPKKRAAKKPPTRPKRSAASAKRKKAPDASEDKLIVPGQEAGPLEDYYKALEESPTLRKQRRLIRKQARLFAEQLANKELPPPASQEGYTPPQTLPQSTHFDDSCVPVDGIARRARRLMLQNLYYSLDGKFYTRKPDLFVAEELRRQEGRAGADLEAIQAILGKKANWRDELVVTALEQKQPKAIAELKEVLWSAALNKDTTELLALVAAMKRRQPIPRKQTVTDKQRQRIRMRQAKLLATLYGLQYEREHGEGVLPSRDEAKAFLRKNGCLPDSLDPKHGGKLDSRFFTKPYLSCFRVSTPWGRFDSKVPITPPQ